MSVEQPQGGQPPAQQFEPVTIPSGDGEITLTPTSAEQAAALKDVAKGVLRQGDYTKKMQQLSQDREAFNRERQGTTVATGRPRSGLGARYGGLSGGRSPGSAVGGERPFAPTYPQGEYPQGGTPTDTRTVSLPALDEDEVLNAGQVRRLLQQTQAEQRAALEQVYGELNSQQQAILAERRIDQMENDPRMPGFSRAAIEEAWYMLNDGEREELSTLPPDVVARLLYHEQLADRSAPQAPAHRTEAGRTTEQPSGQQPATSPPYQEPASGPRADFETPADLSKLQLSRETATTFANAVREIEQSGR